MPGAGLHLLLWETDASSEGHESVKLSPLVGAGAGTRGPAGPLQRCASPAAFKAFSF